jgi:hypothetical protein
MKSLTVSEYCELPESHRELYDAFLNGTYYNCIDAYNVFLNYPNTFRESVLFKLPFKNCHDYWLEEVLKKVALARLECINQMKELLVIDHYPIEFFEDYPLDMASSNASDLILEYRIKKTKAYALLR